MGRTSLTVDDETRDAVEDRQLPSHDSLGETVADLTHLAPAADDFADGCHAPDCDRNPRQDDEYSDSGYIFMPQHIEHEYGGEDHITRSVGLFCSRECFEAHHEEMKIRLPEEPDEVIIGGRGEMQTRFSGATFVIDGSTHELGIPLPGALGGEDRFGNSYDYRGEPVYIMDDERGVLFSYVIGDIIHEETHTGVLLENDTTVEMYHHPDEERRREYKEMHEEQARTDCPACGETVQYPAGDAPETCPACGEIGWLGGRPDSPEGDHE